MWCRLVVLDVLGENPKTVVQETLVRSRYRNARNAFRNHTSLTDTERLL